MRHPHPESFVARPKGELRQFRRATKKNLVKCPHCGLVVDQRYWALHRERSHEALRRKKA